VSNVRLLDLKPKTGIFLDDVLFGLGSKPRFLPCKYFYDDRGSKLFERICELDEYYLTRTELAIMERYSADMAKRIGPHARIVEFGSGSSLKTRLLLDHLSEPIAYVPVDISREHLQQSANALSETYPNIEILPICTDFTQHFHLPKCRRDPSHTIVYFPGSTIGNFSPGPACELARRIALLCGENGGLLIGIDLQKDVSFIEAAYNDAKGVTASFNLNLLRRINEELDGNFDVAQFAHHAFYNEQFGRIEMHVISLCEQTVEIDGEAFEFVKNETIRTEYSHKYTVQGFEKIANQAGLTLRESWCDELNMFAVLYFDVA